MIFFSFEDELKKDIRCVHGSKIFADIRIKDHGVYIIANILAMYIQEETVILKSGRTDSNYMKLISNGTLATEKQISKRFAQLALEQDRELTLEEGTQLSPLGQLTEEDSDVDDIYATVSDNSTPIITVPQEDQYRGINWTRGEDEKCVLPINMEN